MKVEIIIRIIHQNQPCHLLEYIGLKGDAGLRGHVIFRHPSGDERLGKIRGQSASPIHAKPAGTLGEGEIMAVHGDAQGLIIQGQSRRVKIIPVKRSLSGRPGVVRTAACFRCIICGTRRCRHPFHRGIAEGRCPAFRHAVRIQLQPAVLRPAHFLDGGFPAEHVTVASGKTWGIWRISALAGTAAQMNGIPFPLRRFHQVTVAGFLEKNVLMVPGGENGISFSILPQRVRGAVHLVRPPYVSGALDGLTMPLSGSGIRAEQVVPAVLFENMWPLQKNPVRPVNVSHRANHTLRLRIIFLKHQPARIFFRNPVIRHHADHIFSSIAVVEQGWIKAKVIQGNRV